MPAGAHKQQTPRHDGGKSRNCRVCGTVGARVHYAGGFAHRRCIGPERKVHFLAIGCRLTECGRPRDEVFSHHTMEEKKITCARCVAIRI